MGAAASINALSPEELGQGVASLGKAYEAYNQSVVDEGISGEVLFKSVHEDENLFRAFVTDTLGVNKPHHQTAMYSRYVKFLVDGESSKDAGPKMPIFDVRDVVERSPKDILNELFQIQGIPLDPDNVAAAVDKIAAALVASVGEDTGCDGKSLFHGFISYRVAADKDIAEKIYDKLLIKGLFPFLDKYKLLDGQPWKAGFLQGLKGSRCFISLISRKALESCRDKTRNHEHDNVLLEIETALRYKRETGNNAYIIPVLVGEIIKVDGADALRKFADFAGSLYADTVKGNGQASVPVSTIDPAATAINAATAEIAAMKSKAEQEIIEMKVKAENEQIQQVPAKATGVRITGVTGDYADAVNGMYETMTEMSGDMPVYAKVGNSDRWLVYYAPENRWQVVRTANKSIDIAAAYCVISAKGLPHECPKCQWQVSIGEREYHPQPAVTISAVTQQEIEAYLAEVEREATRVVKGSQPVRITGATGVQAILLNGVYNPIDELCGNVTVYVKVDKDSREYDRWLYYNIINKRWCFTSTAGKGKDIGWASCVVPAKCLPQDSPKGQWYVTDDGGKLVQQPAVTITCT